MNKLKAFFTSNSMKSLYWRSSMMFVAATLSQLSISISGWGLTPQATVLLGLVFGEISKIINKSLR